MKNRPFSVVAIVLLLIAGCASQSPAPAPAPAPEAAPAPAPEVKAEPAPAAPAPAPAPMAKTTEKMTLSGDALFDFNKAVIRSDAKAKLDDLIARVKGSNVDVIIIVGHTDRIGSDAYNMKLSMQRAEAAKAYLVSRGVAANRIYTEGKGKGQPVKQCKNSGKKELIACLAPNRRDEIEVSGTRTVQK
jgi:OOP family OmpA-OmpF porin